MEENFCGLCGEPSDGLRINLVLETEKEGGRWCLVERWPICDHCAAAGYQRLLLLDDAELDELATPTIPD